MNDLGKRIKAWRLSLKLDQREFGKRLIPKVTSAAVSGWELGQFEPTASRQEDIAKLLGISRQELLFGDIPEAPESETTEVA
jgi:transcriptional regulator with XRE-family HTH domain